MGGLSPTTDRSGTPSDKSTSLRPEVRILGCPARDEVDELALLMFQQLVRPTRYKVDVIGEEKLVSEIVAEAGAEATGLVCIASLTPGALAHARYLCKRLRAQFADLKIVVGLWGFRGELETIRNSLLSAGADQVGTTLLQTRDQIGNLSQLIASAAGSTTGGDDRGDTAFQPQKEEV